MSHVRIQRRKSVKVAYVEHTGAFQSVPFDRDYERLYGWAREHRLRPGMRPMALFPDNPATTPPEQLRSRVAIAVYGPATDEGEVHVEILPPGEVATTRLRGPASQYAQTYAELAKWTSEHGYEWAGPAREYYHGMPKQKGSELVMDARIEVPVRPRAAA